MDTARAGCRLFACADEAKLYCGEPPGVLAACGDQWMAEGGDPTSTGIPDSELSTYGPAPESHDERVPGNGIASLVEHEDQTTHLPKGLPHWLQLPIGRTA